MTLSERLVSIRKRQGMTQQQVANGAGMPDASLRKYESGRLTPQMETLLRITASLGVSVTDMLDYSESEKRAVLKLEEKYRKIAEELRQMKESGASAQDIESMEDMLCAAIGAVKDSSANAMAKEQAKKLQARAEAIEAQQEGHKERTENEGLLLEEFGKLNAEGQQIAIARLKELAQIDAYRIRKRYNRAR
ncbi:helix-turn-helix domain-containing protein [uncultured Acetatifactor sp.]|uniref:helix-turn-helix domain-containing protein n=1 Tax=uncultured Acetatifactor sp. TaxID=1671927 RepID=UPI00260C9EFE|nr:helix-turn-helix domain-containing protein [uncultured Acetatifactor sp.]